MEDQLTQRPNNNLNFGQALDALKEGKKVCREGWNGKGMWLAYTDFREVNASDFWNEHTKKFARENGGSATVGSYLIFKSAQDTIEMGWKPTSLDMFAENWQIIE